MVEISSRGYRTTEPDSSERETSQVLNKVFAALRQKRMSRTALASELGLHPTDVDALVFGLSFVSLPGGAKAS